MADSLERWEEIAAELKGELEGRHAAREAALKLSRPLIQAASKAIKHVHRGQLDKAEEVLAEAQALALSLRAASESHPEIRHAGYVSDAEKEHVEAACFLAIIKGAPLPDPSICGLPQTYLNGIGEAASEGRRRVLDLLREDDLPAAEKLLGQMVAIYDELVTFDFPDGITGGLRRTCDALRAVIERTQSDLTMTLVQQRLIDRLSD